MDFITSNIRGINKPYILIAEIVTIGMLSNIITYYLAYTCHLSLAEMFIAVTILMIATKYIVLYVTPLKFLQDALDDMHGVQIFGVAIFGATNIFTSLFVLYERFGLIGAAGISIIAPIIAGIIINATNQREKIASQLST